MKTPRHPNQPIVLDPRGVARFKANALVCKLLDHGQKTGLGLNELACISGIDENDWQQLAQLIGYSVSGYGDLSYADGRTVAAADKKVEKLLAQTRAS